MIRIDKNSAAIVIALIAALAGGAELRVAVYRLELKVEALARDVTDVQRELGPREVASKAP